VSVEAHEFIVRLRLMSYKTDSIVSVSHEWGGTLEDHIGNDMVDEECPVNSLNFSN